jgi:hypothetical protein
MLVVDVRDCVTACVAVKNHDAEQTLAVSLRARCHESDDFAARAAFKEFEAISPGEQVCVDVHVGTLTELEVLGVASGAGVSATVTVRPGF